MFGLITGNQAEVYLQPASRKLTKENQVLKAELKKTQEQLNAIEKLSIPDILLTGVLQEEPFGWNNPLPTQITDLLTTWDLSVDKIISIEQEKEPQGWVLELRLQTGNTHSPQDIEEYDFVCKDSAATIDQCTFWGLEEIEVPIDIGQAGAPVEVAVEEQCGSLWPVFQVEKSLPSKDSPTISKYEVKCFFQDPTHGNKWRIKDIDIDPDNGQVTNQKIYDAKLPVKCRNRFPHRPG